MSNASSINGDLLTIQNNVISPVDQSYKDLLQQIGQKGSVTEQDMLQIQYLQGIREQSFGFLSKIYKSRDDLWQQLISSI